MSELKPCPFCGGKAEETQTGDNYVIVRCSTLYCQPNPSAVCYKDDNGDYDFYPWNNRHDDALVKQVAELRELLADTKRIIETSSAIADTVWFNDHTTLCDKIELTLSE